MATHQERRRGLIRLLGTAAVAAGMGAPRLGRAQTGRPITIVVGFAAGGIADALARSAAVHLAQELNRPVLVDNRAGAGGTIAASFVAAAPRDGHTLFLAASGHGAVDLLVKGIRYDPIKDFTAIGGIAQNPLVVIVDAASSHRSVADLAAAGRGASGLSYGSGGIGTLTHLIPELLAATVKTKFVHVPYRGTAPAVADLMGGQVGFVVDLVQTALPHIQAGKVRALAVTSGSRLSHLPDVPALAEGPLPGFDAQGWYGLLAPSGTPEGITEGLNAALVRAMQRPEMQERLRPHGSTSLAGGREAFMQLVREDGQRWRKLMLSLNLQAE